MSEKRFRVVQDPRVQTEYFIYDNENKISMNITDYPFNNEDVCSRIVMLLNKLTEENERLKKDLECCEYRKFKEELDIIHQQVDNKDYSAFSNLKSVHQGDY